MRLKLGELLSDDREIIELLEGAGTAYQIADVSDPADKLVITVLPAAPTNTQMNDYVLALSDVGRVVELDKQTSNSLTVPSNQTVAFPVGAIVSIHQYGAGQTTVVAAGGVTIRSPGGKLKLTGQYSSGALRKRGTDEWVLTGDLTT